MSVYDGRDIFGEDSTSVLDILHQPSSEDESYVVSSLVEDSTPASEPASKPDSDSVSESEPDAAPESETKTDTESDVNTESVVDVDDVEITDAVEDVHASSEAVYEKVSQVMNDDTFVDTSKVSDVKGIPKAVVQRLRQILEHVPSYGKKKADRASIPNIVNGWLIASMHMSSDGFSDDVKDIAAAFVQADALRAAIDSLGVMVESQAKQLRRMSTLASDDHKRLETIELSIAYLLAERTGTLETVNVRPETINMTQARVQAALRRAREQAADVSKHHKRAAGTPYR